MVNEAKRLATQERPRYTVNSTKIAHASSTREALVNLMECHSNNAISHIANSVGSTEEERQELWENLNLAFEDYGNGYPEYGLHTFYRKYLEACAKNNMTVRQEHEELIAQACPGKQQQVLAMFRNDPVLGESLYRLSFHTSEWSPLVVASGADTDISWERWAREEDEQRLSRFNLESLMNREDWVEARMRELREENPELPEGERRLQAQSEFHRSQAEDNFSMILTTLYPDSYADSDLPEEEQQRKANEAREQLRGVFSRYAGPNDPTGFYTFYRQYRTALYETNDTATVDRMEAEIAAVLPEEYPLVLRSLRSHQVEVLIFNMSTNNQLARAAELDLATLQAGGTPVLYQSAIAALYDETHTPRERIENFRAIMREAARGDQQLQALVEVDASIEQTSRIVRALQLQERREGRTRSARRTERVQTVQRIVSSPILSAIGSMRMPERAREAITAVAENPRAREIVSLMLRNGFTATDTHLQGSIAGADVMLHYGNPNEAPRFWIMGNQNNYTFDPSPEGYDTTRMQAMAAEGGSFAVREDESLANVIGLFLAREDLHDEQTMNQFTANKLENFMRLLCGRNADARDERDRLTALGIYRGGSNVSPMQIQRFAIALPHYFGEAGETNIDEEGALGFDAMVTLAQIWEEEGFRLPPANDLIRRTQERTNS